MKKIIIWVIGLIVLVGIGFGGYSLYVANQDIVLDEASPLAGIGTPDTTSEDAMMEEDDGTVMEKDEDAMIEKEEDAMMEDKVISDALDSMDDATMADFKEQTEAMKDVVMDKAESMPASPQLLAEGLFAPRAHEVAGRALLIDTGEKKIVRFEDFETINGPNLHIYLSSSLGGDDFIDLGEIKATNGNVNYELPPNTDTDRYNKVLVWCVPFRVLFSYAELK